MFGTTCHICEKTDRNEFTTFYPYHYTVHLACIKPLVMNLNSDTITCPHDQCNHPSNFSSWVVAANILSYDEYMVVLNRFGGYSDFSNRSIDERLIINKKYNSHRRLDIYGTTKIDPITDNYVDENKDHNKNLHYNGQYNTITSEYDNEQKDNIDIISTRKMLVPELNINDEELVHNEEVINHKELNDKVELPENDLYYPISSEYNPKNKDNNDLIPDSGHPEWKGGREDIGSIEVEERYFPDDNTSQDFHLSVNHQNESKLTRNDSKISPKVDINIPIGNDTNISESKDKNIPIKNDINFINNYHDYRDQPLFCHICNNIIVDNEKIVFQGCNHTFHKECLPISTNQECYLHCPHENCNKMTTFPNENENNDTKRNCYCTSNSPNSFQLPCGCSHDKACIRKLLLDRNELNFECLKCHESNTVNMKYVYGEIITIGEFFSLNNYGSTNPCGYCRLNCDNSSINFCKKRHFIHTKCLHSYVNYYLDKCIDKIKCVDINCLEVIDMLEFLHSIYDNNDEAMKQLRDILTEFYRENEKRFKCRKCGTYFNYDYHNNKLDSIPIAGDAKFSQKANEQRRYYSITCPKCNQTMCKSCYVAEYHTKSICYVIKAIRSPSHNNGH